MTATGTPHHAPARTHRSHREAPLGGGRHPARQLQLRQQRVLPAGDGPGVPAPRLQPLPGREGRDRGRPPYPRRQETRDNEAGLLPQERHLPAPGGSVRSPRRPARRRGPGQGHRQGHGVHRGGLRQPARRPAQVGVPGAGQRRARPAPALAQPRRAEAGLGRRLRPHLRVLPHPVRRPEGARRRRVLHPLLPGLADRPRARPRPRHGARPGLRLRRDVRAERAHRGGARPQPRRSAHLPGPGEERHHHPSRQDEPRRTRPRRRHPQGDHLLRGPARAARQGRLRDGQSALQRGRDRRRQGQEPTRVCPSACPASTRKTRWATGTTSGSATSTAT